MHFFTKKKKKSRKTPQNYKTFVVNYVIARHKQYKIYLIAVTVPVDLTQKFDTVVII